MLTPLKLFSTIVNSSIVRLNKECLNRKFKDDFCSLQLNKEVMRERITFDLEMDFLNISSKFLKNMYKNYKYVYQP